jgi:hypothetical protein
MLLLETSSKPYFVNIIVSGVALYGLVFRRMSGNWNLFISPDLFACWWRVQINFSVQLWRFWHFAGGSHVTSAVSLMPHTYELVLTFIYFSLVMNCVVYKIRTTYTWIHVEESVVLELPPPLAKNQIDGSVPASYLGDPKCVRISDLVPVILCNVFAVYLSLQANVLIPRLLPSPSFPVHSHRIVRRCIICALIKMSSRKPQICQI